MKDFGTLSLFAPKNETRAGNTLYYYSLFFITVSGSMYSFPTFIST